jgi:hypothetical protein
MRRIAPSRFAKPAFSIFRPCRRSQAPPLTTSSLRFPPTICPKQSWHRFVHQVRVEVDKAPSVAENGGQRQLPLQCPGCGAFSQTTTPGEAGFFDVNRRAVKEFTGNLQPKVAPALESQEDRVIQESLDRLPAEKLDELGLDPKDFVAGKDTLHFPCMWMKLRNVVIVIAADSVDCKPKKPRRAAIVVTRCCITTEEHPFTIPASIRSEKS